MKKKVLRLFKSSLLAFFAGIFCVAAQETDTYKNQLSFSTDNDIFVIGRDFDRYYSFGIKLGYQFKTERFLGLQKLFKNKIDQSYTIDASLEGFTSSNAEKFAATIDIEGPENFDRPWTGILYAQLKTTYAFERSFVRLGLLTGIMGPSSQAGALQLYWHADISNDLEYEGWQFQNPDQLLLNISSEYIYDLTPTSKTFGLFAGGQARFGNLYIDAMPVFGFRLGLFESISKTASFGNQLMANKKVTEYFFQSKFGLGLVAFDGTAQGNLLRSDSPYKIDDLSNSFATMIHGIHLNADWLTLGLVYTWEYGRVVPKSTHIYGGLHGSVRF
ncbi:lipid A-modifier LpxR family protein [Spongiivirga citrea]|uniref:DUF2219 family protein n=1 Tax=Spongiivirga citrea TaxID=1481457 RepID=A0A6M0CNW8_9FLAO|nr:lipid A-modifier LpxR family protein [Spongiivirga citrea]NER17177.1 DUF2219 family protein [Spongiivirga citrea]